MALNISFKKARTDKITDIVIPVTKNRKLGEHAKALDKTLGGLIDHALKNEQIFSGKHGEVLSLSAAPKSGLGHIFLLGLGEAEKLDPLQAEIAGGKLFPHLQKAKVSSVSIVMDKYPHIKLIRPLDMAAYLANGLYLRSYNFARYKSKPADKSKAKSKTELSKIEIVCENTANVAAKFKSLQHVSDGVFTARDLVNTAPNDLYPESYAKFIKDSLKPLGVEVEILDEKKMLKLGMGAIMAVGQGSYRQPRMVVMKYTGNAAANDTPVAFVGKGVTFDTGGISLKPGAGMDEMKMDMGGSAAVVGLIQALAARKAAVNVVGIVGLAENMPSSNAYRPGDIITSYSGKTIEVLNTDAEGRLVLADCLTYVQEKYKPKTIIDLATLTGAIIIALGHEYCGTFSTSDALWQMLEESSHATGEKLWRMPLDEQWKKYVESDVADIQNIGKNGRGAGSCTAAGFLQHFIEDGIDWAHLDIAGTAWLKGDHAFGPKFGTGFGVRVLHELVEDHFERKD